MIIYEPGVYLMRNGETATLVRREDGLYPWAGRFDGDYPTTSNSRTWSAEGAYCVSDESGYDLVACFEDPAEPEIEVDLTVEDLALDPPGITYVTDDDAQVDVKVLPKTTRQKVLDAATATVAGRDKPYGKPEDNFQRIALLWTAHLINTGFLDIGVLQNGTGIEPHDVALMMDLVKTARLENDPTHADSWIDKAGYSACGAECAGAVL